MNRLNKVMAMFCLVLIGINPLQAQEKFTNSSMVVVDRNILERNKSSILKGKDEVMEAYKQLIKDADKLMNYKPVSVMDKKDLPPSGSKHDYMSLAPYWWPDPSKPDGLPYIRKDGKTNPEVENYPDKENMPSLCRNIYTLSIAFFYSNEEKYAQHANKLIEVWFLDEATRMNPNLKFGQAIKGRNDGRGAGLIDARHLIYITESAGLMRQSRHWSKANNKNLQQWCADFLNWMHTSDLGKDELDAGNNHGVWYDALALALSLYTNNDEMSNTVVQRAAGRLDTQMNDEGFFPEELERTIALHYSVFILDAFDVIANLSSQTKTDLHKYVSPSGKSLKKAFDAIKPFICNEKEWTGNQIKAFDYANAVPLYISGYKYYNCKNCIIKMKEISGEKGERMLFNLQH